MFEKDEAKKATMLEAYKTDTFPKTAKLLESMLKENGGQWIAGDKVSQADVMMAHLFSPANLKVMGDVGDGELASAAASLPDHVAKVNALPNIKAWIEKRPKTDR